MPLLCVQRTSLLDRCEMYGEDQSLKQWLLILFSQIMTKEGFSEQILGVS